MKGTVANFEFVNPHGMIYIDVKDFKGNIQKWAVETRGGPNVLANAGWDKDTVKPGDQITLVGHLAKNGSNNMRLVKIVFSNGMELYPDSSRWRVTDGRDGAVLWRPECSGAGCRIPSRFS
jgi:hypothetical protein